MTVNQPTAFIVDDDANVRRSLTRLLGVAGFEARAFSSAEEFLEKLDVGEGDCLIADVCLPGMSGPELQQELRHRSIDMPIVFMTGFAEAAYVDGDGAAEHDRLAVLYKPFDAEALLEAIQKAISRHVAGSA